MNIEQSGTKASDDDLLERGASTNEESSMDYSNEKYKKPEYTTSSCKDIPTARDYVPVVPKTAQDLWLKVKTIQATGCLDSDTRGLDLRLRHRICPFSRATSDIRRQKTRLSQESRD